VGFPFPYSVVHYELPSDIVFGYGGSNIKDGTVIHHPKTKVSHP